MVIYKNLFLMTSLKLTIQANPVNNIKDAVMFYCMWYTIKHACS